MRATISPPKPSLAPMKSTRRWSLNPVVVVVLVSVCLSICILFTDDINLRHLFPASQKVAVASIPPAPPTPPTPASPSPPKVALLFLTRGPMPLERTWRDYMAEGSSAVQWTELFSIYVHAPPLYELPPGDFFHNYTIPTAVHGAWGMPSLVAAQKVLYAAALREPRNLRFVLASESCAPLFPRDTLYLQILSESLSRINACQAADEAGAARMMPERWTPALGQRGVPLSMWRKSSQWSSLTRAHAQLAVADQAVYAAFSAACLPHRRPFCYSDEHYLPTLLAMHSLQNETSCAWHLTRALWEPRKAHPKTLTPPMLTQDGLMRLRGEACQVGEDHRQMRGAGEALERYLKSWETQAYALSAHALGYEVERASLRAVLRSEYESMNATECYVLARKVQPDAGEAWLAMLMKEA